MALWAGVAWKLRLFFVPRVNLCLMKLSGHQSIAELWSFSQSSFCSRRRSLASMQTSCPPSNLRASRGLRQSIGCWGGRALLFFTDLGTERGRDVFLKLGPTSAASVGCLGAHCWEARSEPEEPRCWQGSSQGWAGLPKLSSFCSAVAS